MERPRGHQDGCPETRLQSFTLTRLHVYTLFLAPDTRLLLFVVWSILQAVLALLLELLGASWLAGEVKVSFWPPLNIHRGFIPS
jgi:hypothetical protein